MRNQKSRRTTDSMNVVLADKPLVKEGNLTMSSSRQQQEQDKAAAVMNHESEPPIETRPIASRKTCRTRHCDEGDNSDILKTVARDAQSDKCNDNNNNNHTSTSKDMNSNKKKQTQSLDHEDHKLSILPTEQAQAQALTTSHAEDQPKNSSTTTTTTSSSRTVQPKSSSSSSSPLDDATLTAIKDYLIKTGNRMDTLEEEIVIMGALKTSRYANERTRYRQDLLESVVVSKDHQQEESFYDRIYREEESYALANEFFRTVLVEAQQDAIEKQLQQTKEATSTNARNTASSTTVTTPPTSSTTKPTLPSTATIQQADVKFQMNKRTINWLKKAAGLQRPYDPLDNQTYLSDDESHHIANDNNNMNNDGDTDTTDPSIAPRRLTRGMVRSTRVKRRQERIRLENQGLDTLLEAVQELEQERNREFPKQVQTDTQPQGQSDSCKTKVDSKTHQSGATASGETGSTASSTSSSNDNRSKLGNSKDKQEKRDEERDFLIAILPPPTPKESQKRNGSKRNRNKFIVRNTTHGAKEIKITSILVNGKHVAKEIAKTTTIKTKKQVEKHLVHRQQSKKGEEQTKQKHSSSSSTTNTTASTKRSSKKKSSKPSLSDLSNEKKRKRSSSKQEQRKQVVLDQSGHNDTNHDSIKQISADRTGLSSLPTSDTSGTTKDLNRRKVLSSSSSAAASTFVRGPLQKSTPENASIAPNLSRFGIEYQRPIWHSKTALSNQVHAQSGLDLPRRLHSDKQYASLCQKLVHCVSGKARSWAHHEFFYSDIDKPWYKANDFQSDISKLGISPGTKLTRREWSVIRRCIKGRPRRFSKRFIFSQLEKRNLHRGLARQLQRNPQHNPNVLGGYNIPKAIRVGTAVTAYNKRFRILHRGVVLYHDVMTHQYLIQFERPELGQEFCPDSEVASHGGPEKALVRGVDGGGASLECSNAAENHTVLNISRQGLAQSSLEDVNSKLGRIKEIGVESIFPTPKLTIDLTQSPTDEPYMDITENDNLRAIKREALELIIGVLETSTLRKSMILNALDKCNAMMENGAISSEGTMPSTLPPPPCLKQQYDFLLANLKLTNHALNTATGYLNVMFTKDLIQRSASSISQAQANGQDVATNNIITSGNPQSSRTRNLAWGMALAARSQDLGASIAQSNHVPDKSNQSESVGDSINSFRSSRLSPTTGLLLATKYCRGTASQNGSSLPSTHDIPTALTANLKNNCQDHHVVKEGMSNSHVAMENLLAEKSKAMVDLHDAIQSLATAINGTPFRERMESDEMREPPQLVPDPHEGNSQSNQISMRA